MKIQINVNGKQIELDCDPNLRLVYVLRNMLHLCSPKISCSSGSCGSCMILLNDKPIPSCLIPIASVKDSSIITIEGFTESAIYQDIQTAFKQLNESTCGFCDASKYFSAYSILSRYSHPKRDDIYEKIKVLECTCLDTERFINVILLAASLNRKREYDG